MKLKATMNLQRILSLSFLLLIAAAATAPTDEQPESAPQRFQHGTQTFVRDVTEFKLESPTVYVLPIRDEIFGDLAFRFHRMAEKARAANADAIVLDFNTPGGEVGAMKQMLDDILAFKSPVYSFINPDAISAGSLLAIGGDIIVMNPTSQIGAAYPITGTGQQIGEGSERVEEKILSYMRSVFRTTAKARGHDPDLAMRMTDPGHELPNHPNLVKEGELLTLDYDQATSLGLAAYVAKDVDDLLNQAGLVNPTIVRPELTWSEKLAGFTVHPVVSSILMLVALSAFYVEFKTPGIGVAAAVGVLMLSLFFWGKMLADLASYLEVVIFVVGLVLILLEIFVIPGFGVAGILGLVCILGSLIFSMANLPSNTFDPVNLQVLRTPLYVIAGALAMSVPVFMAITRLLPETPMFRGLVTDPNRIPVAREEDALRSAPPRYVGKKGVAISDLRPGGIVQIGEERVHVMTRGEYIEEGTPVKFIAEHGNEYIVSRDEG